MMNQTFWPNTLDRRLGVTHPPNRRITRNKIVPRFYGIVTDFYSRDQHGPYLLGNNPTYADFLVFQALDHDAKTGNAPVGTP